MADDDEWAVEKLNVERSSHSVAELREWYEAGTLLLSPDFRRADAWATPARTLLIDTMLRGFPIPPLHIRSKLVPGTGPVREVVDGQQRLAAVFQFLEDRLQLPTTRDTADAPLPPWAGLHFSHLSQTLQDRVTRYSFGCEVYRENIADALLHEIFARINLHGTALSDQELRNGRFFGEFKQSVHSLAKEYNPFWLAASLFTQQEIAHLMHNHLVSEAIILQISGMQDNGMIDSYYAEYDDSWPDRAEHETRFRATMEEIRAAAGRSLRQSAFNRVPRFSTLYAVVHHRLYGIPDHLGGLPATPRLPLSAERSRSLRSAMDVLSTDQGAADVGSRLDRFSTLWRLAGLSEA
ncbi:DUF262 domain-containing protein [Dactylosporangium sp. NPDC049525]|uniref:DUF262 domain-containing protein n=1 Tax=Dactylosporangium sp. NPDC049525 TaxID=3154730 RepID=UPI003443AF88